MSLVVSMYAGFYSQVYLIQSYSQYSSDLSLIVTNSSTCDGASREYLTSDNETIHGSKLSQIFHWSGG